MGQQLCPMSGPLDFRDACVRTSWSAFTPAALVFLICFFSIPVRLPGPLRKLADIVKAPFVDFLTLPEAEALDADESTTANPDVAPVPLWRTLVLTWIALSEALIWLALGSFRIFTGTDVWAGVLPILIASSWLYAAARPVVYPTPTAPADLFSLYAVHLVFGVLLLGGVLFEYGFGISLPDTLGMLGLVGNIVAVFVLISVVLAMPLAVPSKSVKKEDIGVSVSPEDYTSLFGWITFSWVHPLIKRGTSTTLNEDDVWELSPTIQSRPVFIKFSGTKRATLIRQLWASNSLDLILDFVLTFVSVVFNYAGPFFLKRILDAIDDPTPESRARAYIYAFLAFLCTLLKAQADVQHLWFGRRAATRMRMELMAAIYDKALKRRDYSGVVDKDKNKAATPAAESTNGVSANGKGKDKEKERQAKEDAKKADDPKAGADVGKIVNLMAGDANRVAQMVSGAYLIYGAPFEIGIAGVFLYQLLGWSAFAGFLVLIVGWPLNSFIARRSIRIQKGVLAARDKRMGVLNELIGSVKFVKFFAWEERWIERALASREIEMGWMVKARINSVMFSLLWTSAPIFVSVISFFTFVVQGKQLTVSIAFTAIALFNMIRAPLNVIPAWIVQILQTGVALNRISTYLGEDEVSEQVSTLKKSRTGPIVAEEADEGLGIENGSFKWNEVEEVTEKDGKDKSNGKNKDNGVVASPSDETDTAVDAQSTRSIESTPSDHHFELRDISVIFPEGRLTCITGPTASGKTALLMALLGEMTSISGRLIMSKEASRIDKHGLMHAISYAAQSPWLRHQSIKDNILFGYPYDEERYNAVVECCALNPDLAILEDGDATEIGAKGVSLSGGQKARVALARAVYARTKYVLLDDPLSAVDSHTSRFLFDRLLRGPLLANRTVILVTHHIELVLPGTHYLVRMLDGRIDTQGTVEDLRSQGVLDEIAHDAAVEVIEEEQVVASEAPVDVVDPGVIPEDADRLQEKKPRRLVKDEHRETGGVKWSIYKTYLKASSYWTWGILTFLIILSQLLGVTEKLWIKTWGEAYGPENQTASYIFTSFATGEHETVMDGHLTYHHLSNSFRHIQASPIVSIAELPNAQDRPLFYIGIYGLIALATALASVTSVITQFTGALKASRLLFERLLVGVVRATMRWHDVTPQGRMLNRFGKDIETIDSSLASSLQAVNSSLATFFAAILTVAVIFPWSLVPAIIIGFGYRQLAIGYLNTGRDLRRMESNTRSPIFSGFGELLEGIVTVRAFSAEQRFLDNLHLKINTTTKMWYNFWMTNRWLLLNFDALGALAVLVTTLFAVSGFVSAGIAGLCITSAMAFTSSIYWACRFWTALELDLNSVERVVEYLDLPQEPPAVIESSRPPAYWPSSSNQDSLITVEDLVIKYAPELPPVLHGVSFTLKARERIGLLGRTGSGKSTLAMSILRFVDPISGRILIDGIDISTIGIHDLRSRLTFIPQDATLFSGTLRDNLDPFNEHDDSECLDVLYRVQMLSESAYQSQKTSREPSRASSIHNVEREDSSPSISPTITDADAKTTISLDTQVSAGGANFSQGQRQLIAMARALLRRSSIIVLDEATSSIDFSTDAKIQATIREEFGDSLLLTVAHRIRTIIDYDRLIVLDKGQIVEFDTPLNLIGKEDGVFRNMCLKSGTFSELEAAAKAKAELDDRR